MNLQELQKGDKVRLKGQKDTFQVLSVDAKANRIALQNLTTAAFVHAGFEAIESKEEDMPWNMLRTLGE